MYLPAHFEENRVEELHRIITEFPFGALVVNGPNGLDANHFPFMFDPQAGGQGKLLAHVARNSARGMAHLIGEKIAPLLMQSGLIRHA